MRYKAFHRSQWPSVVIQLGLIVLAVLVFDILPDQFIAPLVPEDSQRIYWAVLLGVKNPTIIAFTLVWIVGIFRQAMSYEPGNAQQADGFREGPALIRGWPLTVAPGAPVRAPCEPRNSAATESPDNL